MPTRRLFADDDTDFGVRRSAVPNMAGSSRTVCGRTPRRIGRDVLTKFVGKTEVTDRVPRSTSVQIGLLCRTTGKAVRIFQFRRCRGARFRELSGRSGRTHEGARTPGRLSRRPRSPRHPTRESAVSLQRACSKHPSIDTPAGRAALPHFRPQSTGDVTRGPVKRKREPRFLQ